MPVTIDEQIANYREARVIVVQGLTELDDHIQALVKAKKLLEQEVKVAIPQFDGREHPNRMVPTQVDVKLISQPDVDTSAIIHSTSIPEAMYAWADANGGILDGKALAAALRIVGISKAKNVNSAAATIHNVAVKAHAKHWAKIGTNRFRRIYAANEEPSEPDNGVHEHEQDPEQPLAADSPLLAAIGG